MSSPTVGTTVGVILVRALRSRLGVFERLGLLHYTLPEGLRSKQVGLLRGPIFRGFYDLQGFGLRHLKDKEEFS